MRTEKRGWMGFAGFCENCGEIFGKWYVEVNEKKKSNYLHSRDFDKY